MRRPGRRVASSERKTHPASTCAGAVHSRGRKPRRTEALGEVRSSVKMPWDVPGRRMRRPYGGEPKAR